MGGGEFDLVSFNGFPAAEVMVSKIKVVTYTKLRRKKGEWFLIIPYFLGEWGEKVWMGVGDGELATISFPMELVRFRP